MYCRIERRVVEIGRIAVYCFPSSVLWEFQTDRREFNAELTVTYGCFSDLGETSQSPHRDKLRPKLNPDIVALQHSFTVCFVPHILLLTWSDTSIKMMECLAFSNVICSP